MFGLFLIFGSIEVEVQCCKVDLDVGLDIGFLYGELVWYFGLMLDDILLDWVLFFDLIDWVEFNVFIVLCWLWVQILFEVWFVNWMVWQVVLFNIIGGYWMVVGMFEQVVDDILCWIDGDVVDGFNLNIDVQILGFEDIVDYLILIL